MKMPYLPLLKLPERCTLLFDHTAEHYPMQGAKPYCSFRAVKKIQRRPLQPGTTPAYTFFNNLFL